MMKTKRLAVRSSPQSSKKWTATHQSQERVFQNTGVYLMWNIPFFMLNKLGISDTVGKRRKTVSETTPGIVFTVLSFELAFGLEIEQFVHGLYKLQNVRFWTGSGRTEWFIVFSPIVGFSTLYLNQRFGLGLNTALFTIFDVDVTVVILAFFTPFVWWDGLFWLLFFWLFKIILIGAAFMFFVYAVAHIN
jgi:hypothetical protein